MTSSLLSVVPATPTTVPATATSVPATSVPATATSGTYTYGGRQITRYKFQIH